ncbi:MAG: phage capsid protein [Defluviitoga tunisiensis]
MAVKNFIPQIWSSRLLKHLDMNLVFKSLVNTDYEGEIKNFGDTVRVNQIGPIGVNDWVKNRAIDVQDLDSTQAVLTIDQARYFAFQVYDVDAAQANVNLMDAAMERAAYSLAKDIDTFIAGKYKEAGIKLDNGYTVVSGEASTGEITAYDLIVEISSKFDEKNVPDSGRWLVIPPWFHAMLLKSDEYKMAVENYKTTGVIPRVAGIQILKSNNLQTKTESNTLYHYLMGGTNMAISFAMQVQTTEAMRSASNFADVVRGLVLYGAKVFYPEALVSVKVKRGE